MAIVTPVDTIPTWYYDNKELVTQTLVSRDRNFITQLMGKEKDNIQINMQEDQNFPLKKTKYKFASDMNQSVTSDIKIYREPTSQTIHLEIFKISSRFMVNIGGQKLFLENYVFQNNENYELDFSSSFVHSSNCNQEINFTYSPIGSPNLKFDYGEENQFFRYDSSTKKIKMEKWVLQCYQIQNLE